jgi:hypothetical protein
MAPGERSRILARGPAEVIEEEQLVNDIIEFADDIGLRWHRCPDSRRCRGHRGFPDLMLLGCHGVIFAEIKSRVGVLSPDQQTFKWMLLASGQRWFLWRRADWDSGQVQAELRAIA